MNKQRFLFIRVCPFLYNMHRINFQCFTYYFLMQIDNSQYFYSHISCQTRIRIGFVWTNKMVETEGLLCLPLRFSKLSANQTKRLTSQKNIFCIVEAIKVPNNTNLLTQSKGISVRKYHAVRSYEERKKSSKPSQPHRQAEAFRDKK